MAKEWKGNKKSVSAMLGMSTIWNPEQRAAADYYTTDPTAVRQFINHLQIAIITALQEVICRHIKSTKDLGYDAFLTIRNIYISKITPL